MRHARKEHETYHDCNSGDMICSLCYEFVSKDNTPVTTELLVSFTKTALVKFGRAPERQPTERTADGYMPEMEPV